MGPYVVVDAAPLLQEDVHLLEGVEDLPVEEFVPQLAVEALVVAVLPRAAQLDEQRLRSDPPQPPPDPFRGELAAVV